MVSATLPIDDRAPETAPRKLPEYAAELSAFHQAFAPELREAIATFAIAPQMRVLDVCCGDGFYLELLGERLSSAGRLVGLDSNQAYLELARTRLNSLDFACDMELICGTIEQMRTGTAAFDFIWCAQSLFSLPDPVIALREIADLLRPGGTIAVLENDTLHQLQLPWPGHLEIDVRKAELAALENDSEEPEKYYVGRRLPEIFSAAGLKPGGCRTQVIDRLAPFEVPLLKFLNAYLSRLSQRVAAYLPPAAAKELDSLIDPQGKNFLLARPYVSMTWLNTLAWGSRFDEKI